MQAPLIRDTIPNLLKEQQKKEQPDPRFKSILKLLMSRECDHPDNEDLVRIILVQIHHKISNIIAIKLTEGVGLLDPLYEGLQSPLSSSVASVLTFLLAQVLILSLGGTYSGYLPMGSPCPLMAGLNLASWVTLLTLPQVYCFFQLINFFASSSTPNCCRLLEKVLPP